VDRTPDHRTGPALVLDFDSGQGFGEDVTRVSNQGSAGADVSIETAGTPVARLTVVDGPDGSKAVRFPPYNRDPNDPVALIVASPAEDDPQALDPGARDFSFGATFALDLASDGNANDNGDNLVQRGSYEGPGQFKLQLDGRRPSCRVLGDSGDVTVQGDIQVLPRVWYSLRCTRTATAVTMRLSLYGDKSQDKTWSKRGVTGNLRLLEPLSVGGKVREDGSPRSSADQFNGAVDHVFLDIG
jgi:hypothetical protein